MSRWRGPRWNLRLYKIFKFYIIRDYSLMLLYWLCKHGVIYKLFMYDNHNLLPVFSVHNIVFIVMLKFQIDLIGLISNLMNEMKKTKKKLTSTALLNLFFIREPFDLLLLYHVIQLWEVKGYVRHPSISLSSHFFYPRQNLNRVSFLLIDDLFVFFFNSD